MKSEIKRCRKNKCNFRICGALFGGHYVFCVNCENSAGIERTPEQAIGTWNRWLMDDPRRRPVEVDE